MAELHPEPEPDSEDGEPVVTLQPLIIVIDGRPTLVTIPGDFADDEAFDAYVRRKVFGRETGQPKGDAP